MNSPIEATLDECQHRSSTAAAAGAAAFARLLHLAEQRDSGQIARIAGFLAATYNGQAFKSCSSEHDANNANAALMRSQAPRRAAR